MADTISIKSTTQRIVVDPGTSSVVVVHGGPVGPAGPSLIPPGGTPGQVIGTPDGTTTTWMSVGTTDEIDTKIAEHNQSLSPIHTQATSGRDFAARFLLEMV